MQNLERTRKKRPSKPKKKRSESRLSSQDRRIKILQGALVAFSKKGFHSTTTKEIAASLGISEALLFKHFPTKNDLTEALQSQIQSQMDSVFLWVLSQPKNSDTFVSSIIYNFLVLVEGKNLPAEKAAIDRLVVFSLLSDGKFFRSTNEKNLPKYLKFLHECYQDAVHKKEVAHPYQSTQNGLWFCHHLAAFILLATQSNSVQYEGMPKDLKIQVVEFCLRGLGFTNQAINRHLKDKVEMF